MVKTKALNKKEYNCENKNKIEEIILLLLLFLIPYIVGAFLYRILPWGSVFYATIIILGNLVYVIVFIIIIRRYFYFKKLSKTEIIC